jgi:hypothetical protein
MIVQAVLFVGVFNASAVAPANPGRLVTILGSIFLVAVQLAMPGFLLFVPEHGGSSLIVRVIAIIFDIAIYSLLISAFLWWREVRRTTAATVK